MHVFGLWQVPDIPRENLCRHKGDHTHIHHTAETHLPRLTRVSVWGNCDRLHTRKENITFTCFWKISFQGLNSKSAFFSGLLGQNGCGTLHVIRSLMCMCKEGVLINFSLISDSRQDRGRNVEHLSFVRLNFWCSKPGKIIETCIFFMEFGYSDGLNTWMKGSPTGLWKLLPWNQHKKTNKKQTNKKETSCGFWRQFFRHIWIKQL